MITERPIPMQVLTAKYRPAAVLCTALTAALLLASCAGTGGVKEASSSAVGDRYACDQGMRFAVRFANDSALLTSARGDDVLLRDAGGQGAQTVYSNPRLRAEFGRGTGGQEAVLQYLGQPLMVRCTRVP